MDRSNFLLGAVIILLVVSALRKVHRRILVARFKRANGCQEPAQLPQSERIIGWRLFLQTKKTAAEHRRMESITQRFDENGKTYQATFMGMTPTFTVDPENLKAVLATKFEDFGLGERLTAFGPLLGSGIFTSDDRHWEHSRALLRPTFTKTQIADLHMFEEHVQELIAKVPRSGATIDLQRLFFNMTLDSSTQTLFGESVHSQRAFAENGGVDSFSESFDYAQEQLPWRSRLGIFHRLHRDPKFFASCEKVHKFVDRIVYDALQRRQSAKSDAKSLDTTSLSRYVFLNELMDFTTDPRRLRDEMLNILLAGRDTTAGVLSNMWYALARHPQVWTRLREEVERLDGQVPSYQELRDMEYLKCVVNETLRLYPSVPFNARHANKDTFIPRGGGIDGDSPVFIPKGGMVIYSVYSMHRQPDVFGEDFEEFKPERWIERESGKPLRPGWGYLPFNGGPRTCLGQQYALTEAMYTTVRLLQTFQSIESRDSEPWRECIGLTLSSLSGTKVSLQPL